MDSSSLYAIATCDSKGVELQYLADRAQQAGIPVTTVDVGTLAPPSITPNLSRECVARCHPAGADKVFQHRDRGQAISAMSEALSQFLIREYTAGKVAGVIGLGGTGGTALISPALRALPIGLPKLLVSTVASGNTNPYVGSSDIAMLYSVVDVAGINKVSRAVLSNAAHAMAGMIRNRIPAGDQARTTLGMTMFGVTTPCVDRVREHFTKLSYDCLVFHATGVGGQAMEKLVASGMIDGVLDITTTEIADEVVGGVFRSGPARFDEILRRRIPYVMSLGAMDMVNFGAKETVPSEFRTRLFHVHNAQVTLMRTTVEENRRCARWIANKVNLAASPVTILIPEKGVSLLDAPGQPFHDPEADAALFEELEAAVRQDDLRRIIRVPAHINDPEFASQIIDTYLTHAKNH